MNLQKLISSTLLAREHKRINIQQNIITLAFVEPLMNQRSSSTTPRQNTFYEPNDNNECQPKCQINEDFLFIIN